MTPRSDRRARSPHLANRELSWPQFDYGASLDAGSWIDAPDLDQLEAERFDLGNAAEQRRPIRKHTGEHGLAALQLSHQRGKGRQSGGSKPTLYPDLPQARWCHASMMRTDLVNSPRRDQVIFAPAAGPDSITGIWR